MSIGNELANVKSVFFDTAPIIYYIEAHPEFGPIIKEMINYFRTKNRLMVTSAITITEVLPKPVYGENMVH